MLGGVLTPGKVAPVGDEVGGLNTKTLEAVPPALNLKPQNSVSPPNTLELAPLLTSSLSSPEPRVSAY